MLILSTALGLQVPMLWQGISVDLLQPTLLLRYLLTRLHLYLHAITDLAVWVHRLLYAVVLAVLRR
jgi:hypothetical protein